MRVTSRLTLLAVLTSIGAAAGAQTAPPVHEVESTDLAEKMADRLGRMGEPILSDSRNLGGFTRRLRMLVVESFAPTYAVRVDETPAGARLSLVLQEASRDPQSPYAHRTLALSTGERRRLDTC